MSLNSRSEEIMKQKIFPLIFGLLVSLPVLLWGQDGLIEKFDLKANDLAL